MPKTARYGRKRSTRQRRRRTVNRRAPLVRISKPMKSAIQKIVRKNIETKYVAEYIAQNQGVTAGTAAVPTCLKRMIPQLPQGVADANRIAEKVTPVRANMDITVHFQSTPTGGTSGPCSDLEVHCLVLLVKGAKNAATVGQTPASTLLKNGTGGNFDPLVGSVSQAAFIEDVNHCPVNTEQFTVLRRFKHRFAKGDYDLNGPASGTGNAQKSVHTPCHTFRYSWKPPTLDYNSNLDVFPTNHYPVYVLWVSALDGGSYGGNVYYGARTEMYYKDA